MGRRQVVRLRVLIPPFGGSIPSAPVKRTTIFMDFPALFSAVFISCFVLSLTVYSVYLGFGPGSEELRDPFEEHQD